MAIKRDTRVARRYASALLKSVEEGGIDGIDGASADLTVVTEMLKTVPYLRAVLQQPLVPQERKLKLATDAFKSRLGEKTFGFLTLLIRKRRENIIDSAILEFRRLADERAGRLEAHVVSARPLSAAQLTGLQGALEKRTGKTVRLTSSIDAKILGGLRVQFGDSVIDGTLSTRLERIHQRLTAVR
jgi:F-type H+-transporting ATPase subunit delta